MAFQTERELNIAQAMAGEIGAKAEGKHEFSVEKPDVFWSCRITLISGMIGLFGAPPGTILTGDPLMIGLMGFVVMPVSWGLLTLAPRHTSPTNVSLFMLLEMVLGPFWVWMGTGEHPSAAMIGGAALVLVTLGFHFLSSAREVAKPDRN